MIRNLMSALTSKGTARALLAGLAIAWGIKILSEIGDELQARIDELEAHLSDLANQLSFAEAEAVKACPEFVEPPAEAPTADHDQARRYLDAFVDHIKLQGPVQ